MRNEPAGPVILRFPGFPPIHGVGPVIRAIETRCDDATCGTCDACREATCYQCGALPGRDCLYTCPSLTGETCTEIDCTECGAPAGEPCEVNCLGDVATPSPRTTS